MKNLTLLFLSFLFSVSACQQGKRRAHTGLQDTVIVSCNDPHIHFMGRINDSGPDQTVFYWPGTSLMIHFKGQKAEILLKDQRGENYYNVIVDGETPALFHPDSLKQWYVLADSLSVGEHTLKLFKRTEWSNGNTRFYKLRITGQAKILPSLVTSGKIIEFYGNSITTGYADRDYSGKDSPDSTLTDNYVTYGAITARHYNADYYCIAKGGIGILISWFPLIMPEMYDRLDPENPGSKWNFTRVKPGIVVINLFQNDSWLVNKRDYPEFKHRFGDTPPTEQQIIDAYKDFVGKIRSVYPEANIICSLGSMDATREGSLWPGYISKAVKEMNDDKIFTLFFPYMNKPGHPRVEDHRIMADTLIHFIDKHIHW